MKQITAILQPHRLEKLKRPCTAYRTCLVSPFLKRMDMRVGMDRIMPTWPMNGTRTAIRAWYC